MANIVYNIAKKEIADNTINLLTDTLKVMLVSSVYVPNADDLVVDAGGANDAIDAELSGAGYVAGFGGGGRKPLLSRTLIVNNTTDKAEFDGANILWPAINAGTAVGAILIKETGADDTTTRLIQYLDIGTNATNGGNLTLQFNAVGLLTFS